jgi:hypothetical protein
MLKKTVLVYLLYGGFVVGIPYIKVLKTLHVGGTHTFFLI